MTGTLVEAVSHPVTLSPPRPRARSLVTTNRLVIGGITLLAGLLATWNILGAPGVQDDEGTYTAQAMAVQNGSLAPYTYWYDHPPLGWVQLAVAGTVSRALGLGGGSEIGAMRYISAANFVVCAILIYVIARRVGVRMPFAVMASLAFVLSPLSLTLGRQVYLDTLATPWLLLAFALAISPPRRLGQHAGAGIAFGVAVLTKLTVALFGPALVVALLDRTGVRGPRFPLVGFLSAGALSLVFFPLMALLRGELLSGPGHVSLQDALSYQFISRTGSGWLWEAGSGRETLVYDWLSRDPLILVLGSVAGAICVSSKLTRWISVAILTFIFPVMLSQGYLPAMYVYASLPFMALAIGAAAEIVLRRTSVPVARLSGLGRRALGVATGVVVIVVLAVPTYALAGRFDELMVDDANADWRAAVAWTKQNVAHDQVMLVPYSVWTELESEGATNPWQLIAMEKADLDSEFLFEHPQGWREIQWMVEGPMVRSNITSLQLTTAESALEHSVVMQTFGGWKVRRVVP